MIVIIIQIYITHMHGLYVLCNVYVYIVTEEEQIILN